MQTIYRYTELTKHQHQQQHGNLLLIVVLATVEVSE